MGGGEDSEGDFGEQRVDRVQARGARQRLQVLLGESERPRVAERLSVAERERERKSERE